MSQYTKSRATFLEPDDAGVNSTLRKKPSVKQSRKLVETAEIPREQPVASRAERRHGLEDLSEDDTTKKVGRRETRSMTKRRKIGEEAKEGRPHTPLSAEITSVEEREIWETLVIGDLGHNLSYIEEKDREILQQRYILEHHEKNSPGQAEHHKRLLDELTQERLQMEDDEENYLPAEQREANNRITERVETLHWALDTCKCDAEAVNVRAALQGYASGEIGYSENFTLIYGGHIIDVCPTYQSFCVDRSERLRRYGDKFGTGWLWIEPPLAGPTSDMLAMKGLCVNREPANSWGIGHYGVHLNFEVDKSKVMSEGIRSRRRTPDDIREQAGTKTEAHFKTLLDSGATVPMLHHSDLRHLAIDMKWYSAQGVVSTNTANGELRNRFFEMCVSVCTKDGKSIVGQSNSVTWPEEPPVLGAFLPVIISDTVLKGKRTKFTNRLSGLLPFDAAYISSAPTMGKIWLGEDRRDVLGASRFPGHLRYDTEKTLKLDYPQNLDGIRIGTETPDAIIFAHHLKDNPGSQFVDTDRPGKRGSSEWTIKRARQQGGGNGEDQRLALITEDTAEIKPPERKTRVAKVPPGWRSKQMTRAQIRAENKKASNKW